MNVLHVRAFRDSDKKEFAEFLFNIKDKNRFDPEIFKSASTKIYVAFDEKGNKLFMPVRPVYLLESLAPNPENNPIDTARALHALQMFLEGKASENGVLDMFFCTYDENVLKFAQKDNHGWKPVVVPILNLKLSDLEKKDDTPTNQS